MDPITHLPAWPAPIADIAYQNKAVVYDLLFKAPRCLGSAATVSVVSAEVREAELGEAGGARLRFCARNSPHVG